MRNAYLKANDYLFDFAKIKQSAMNNFEDMDFKNAQAKVDMKIHIDNIVAECDHVIRAAGDLDYE